MPCNCKCRLVIHRKKMSNLISKSRYIKGQQCLRALWLSVYHRDLGELPKERIERMQEGTDVGVVAREVLFPGGVLVTKGIGTPKTAEKTSQLIAEGHRTLYEATFVYNDCLIMADILHCGSDGRWRVYEVKSSFGVKPYYLDDAALQYYVLSHTQIQSANTLFSTADTPSFDLADVFVVHLKSEDYKSKGYRLSADDFVTVSVLEECRARQAALPPRIEALKKVLADEATQPEVTPGEQCQCPFLCEFWKVCHKEPIPQDV